MYVPGKLHDVEHVLIDVGTGYYVEKVRQWGGQVGQGLLVFLPLPLILQTAEDAKDFFKRKIDFLTKQMEKIQPALQEKHAMKQGEFYPELLFCKIISIVFCLSASGRWGWGVGHTNTVVHVWRFEEIFQESVFSFHPGF